MAKAKVQPKEEVQPRAEVPLKAKASPKANAPAKAKVPAKTKVPAEAKAPAKAKAPAPVPLIGKELLKKVKDLSHLPKRETARECGYYSLTKDGQVRVNLGDFYDAVLNAKGIQLEPEKVSSGRGREASYLVKVHKNGQIVIGSAYTQEMGLQPGDEFQLKLGYKNIRLVKQGAEDEE